MKLMKRSISSFLSILLIFSLLITPEKIGYASGINRLEAQETQSSEFTSITDLTNQEEQLLAVEGDGILFDNDNRSERISKAQLELIHTNFTTEMLQIVAYFYPELNEELTLQQILEKQQWTESYAHNRFRNLSPDAQKQIQELAPLVALSAEYEINPAVLEEIVNASQMKSVTEAIYSTISSVMDDVYGNHPESGFLLSQNIEPGLKADTDKNSSYKYEENTNDAIDPIYRTSNQKNVDLNLKGRNGLDISLVRSYNSLNAKITDPTYSNENLTADQIEQCKENITYFTNESDCLGNIPQTAWLHSNENFIATGWELNIPTMSKTFRDSIRWLYVPSAYTDPNSPEYYLTEFYSRSYGHSIEDQELTFRLDDGTTYTFQGTKTTPSKQPYDNVTYTRGSNNHYYLTVNDQITYEFTFDDITGTGQILSKSNRLGDQITYNYQSDRIVITDTVARTIEVHYAPIQSGEVSKQITGIIVKDSSGTVIYQLEYQTSFKSLNTSLRKFQSDENETYGIQNVSTSYVQLNAVYDMIGNHQLETYTYFDPNTIGTHADFNMEDDYKFKNDAEGSPKLEVGKMESSDIVEREGQTYGELVYLLLKSIDTDTGLKTQYEYQFYNPTWINAQDYLLRDAMRGTTRLYLDQWVLTYIGYHPVIDVTYSYNSQDSSSKVLMDKVKGENNTEEVWRYPRIDTGRLRSSLVRNGDIVSTAWTRDQIDYKEIQTDTYRLNPLGIMVLASQISETEGLTNSLDSVEGSTRYIYAPKQVETYVYDNLKTNPSTIYSSDAGFSQDPKPDKIRMYLEQPLVGPPAGINNYATKNKLEYDTFGFVVSATDDLGNTTIYQYNGPNHQTSYSKLTAADGLTTVETTYSYNTNGVVDKVTQHNSFLDEGVKKTDKTETVYSQFNAYQQPGHMQVTSTGDQVDTTMVRNTDLQYSSNGLHVTQQTSYVTLHTDGTPEEVTTQYQYDIRDRLTKTIYSDGSAVDYSYDWKDRLISETFTPSGSNPGNARTATYIYDDATRTITYESPDGEKWMSYYSPYGGLEKQTQQIGTNLRTLVVNHFNETGLVLHETLPFGEATKKTQYVYGANGKVAKTIDALNQETIYNYANAAHQTNGSATYLQDTIKQIDPDGKETWTYIDRHGRVEKIVEKSANKLRTTKKTNDALGRVRKLQLTSRSQIQTTEYKYDAFGNVISLKDEMGNINTYKYDAIGKVTRILTNGVPQKTKTYNETGWLLSDTNATGQVEKYDYNILGLVKEYKDKSGKIHQYSYTPYYEEQRFSIKDNGAEVYWSQQDYDDNTRLLTGLSTSEGENLTYTYDEWNRLGSQTVAGKHYSLGYNQSDQLTTLTYPDQKQVSYTYDPLQRLKTVNYPDMGTVNYDYNVGSNANNYTISYPNLVSQVRVTDAFGELVSVTFGKGIGAFQETFGYDGFGNIISILDNRMWNLTTFKYDGLNRIQEENHHPLGTNSYEYDDRGNRTSLKSDMASILIDGSETFTYNALNQLKSFTKTDTQALYTYYGDGLRASKTVNGERTQYVYLNGHVIDELNASGNSTARNIFGNELLFRKDEATSKAGYYYYNGHGDVVAIKDNAGYDINTYSYDIWGNILERTEGMNNPFAYTGEIHDEESGLIYLRARYYDPQIGRFITEDTYEGQITNPLSLNLYTYAHNNPLIYSDPTGHFVWVIPGIIGLVEAISAVIVVATGVTVGVDLNDKGINVFDTIESKSTVIQEPKLKIYSKPYVSTPPVTKKKVIVSQQQKVNKGPIVSQQPKLSEGADSGYTFAGTKTILKERMLPTTGKIRYIPPAYWTPSQPLPRTGNGGYIDKFGNVWSKGPSRTAGQPFEWDVNLSNTGKAQLEWASRDGSHLNVSLDGKITHK